MAEGLLKKMLADKGKNDIQVSSAGMLAIGGFTPTENTIKVMKKEGIDVSGYKAAKLTLETIKEADIILAMEKIHKDKVINFVPEAKEKTYLLREYIGKNTPHSNSGIPDPIGKPLEVYERVLDMIKESIKELVKKL